MQIAGSARSQCVTNCAAGIPSFGPLDRSLVPARLMKFGKLEFIALPCKNVLFLLRQEKNQKNAAQEGASAACSRTPIPPLLRTSPRTWVRWKNVSDFGFTAPKPCRIHRKCAPGGVLRGGGFVCGSKQLNASPKLSSLPTFL